MPFSVSFLYCQINIGASECAIQEMHIVLLLLRLLFLILLHMVSSSLYVIHMFVTRVLSSLVFRVVLL